MPNVTIKIDTKTDTAPVQALQRDMAGLGDAASLARRSFMEFNAGLELSRKAFYLLNGAVTSLPRALLSASEAAAGNKGFMEGLDESYRRVEVSIGKVVNSTGVLTDYFEGTRQIADTLAASISGSTVEAQGFREAMQNLVIPSIKLVVSVGAAAIGGAASLARDAFASTTAAAAMLATVLSKIPGAGGAAKGVAGAVADLALYTKSLDDIEKAAAKASTAVADLEVKFSGGTALPPPKPKDVTKKAATSLYTREGEDARGAVDEYNERLAKLAEAQQRHDEFVARTRLDFEASVADERYARKQEEQDRLTQIEVAAEEERMRFAQGVQQQITGFAQGTFDELGRGFARLVTTGKFGAKEFGAAILSMTGQQAATRGSYYLLEGAAALALGNPGGAAAIAAGLGLITLGGTLSGIASSMGARGAGTGAPSASYAANDIGPRRGANEDREQVIVMNINTGGTADVHMQAWAANFREAVRRGAVNANGVHVNLA